VSRPEPLFDINGPVLESIYWAISADGEQFLTVNSQMVTPPTYCNLVLDWPGILDRR